jgi:hypothetical protein
MPSREPENTPVIWVKPPRFLTVPVRIELHRRNVGGRIGQVGRVADIERLNHASFGDPSLTTSTAQFGVIRSTSITGRQIQLGAKLLF